MTHRGGTLLLLNMLNKSLLRHQIYSIGTWEIWLIDRSITTKKETRVWTKCITFVKMWCGEARNNILKTKHTTVLFKQCGIAYFFLRLFKTSVYREATRMGGSNYDNWLGYEQIILRRRVVQTSDKKKTSKMEVAPLLNSFGSTRLLCLYIWYEL